MVNKGVRKQWFPRLSKEHKNRVITPPIAQLNSNNLYVNDVQEWKEIYSSPFRTSLDTKLREFQYKLHNRCLMINFFISKIGIIPPAACSFYDGMSESLEHFFISCHDSTNF